MSENHQEIDLNRLYDLMEDYRTTNDREEQRRIENEVLEETVWQVQQKEYVLTEADLRTLLDRIDDDDEVTRRILSRPFVNSL